MELGNSCLNGNNSNSRTVGTQTNFEASPVSSKDFDQANPCPNDFDEVQKIYDLETRALSVIRNVLDTIEQLRVQIENFSGISTDDKEYKYLDETMTRGLVTLDELQSNGNMMIKQERKRAVQYIQKLMKMLDCRLRENRDALQKFVDSDDEM